MSKTVEAIGLIVGGLALAVFSGPIGIVALQGNMAAFHALLGIGISAALSGVGVALRPNLNPVGTANSVGFNQGVEYRRVIYGQFQTAGVLTYASFPPSQNLETTSEFAHLIYTLCGHEITSFDAVSVNGFLYNFGTDIYADSDLPGMPWEVHPDENATPNDFFWEHLLFEFDSGTSGNESQPFPNLAASDPTWTSACLQRGCAKVHVILRYDSGWTALYQNGQMPNIQFLVTGKKLIDPRIITAWVPGTAHAEWSYIVDNSGMIWFASSGGTSSGTRPAFEANDGSIGGTLGDGGVTWLNTGWTVDRVYAGSPTAAPPQLFNAVLVSDGWQPSTIYGSGSINILVIEAPTGYFQVLTGAGTAGTAHPIFSTTLGGTTTDGTATWTCLGRSTHALNPSNSALCVRDYLTDSDYGMGTDPSTIDDSTVMAAANVCEETVSVIYPV